MALELAATHPSGLAVAAAYARIELAEGLFPLGGDPTTRVVVRWYASAADREAGKPAWRDSEHRLDGEVAGRAAIYEALKELPDYAGAEDV